MAVTDARSGLGNAAAAGGSTAPGRRVLDFVALTKPRPMAVVIFSAIVGLIAAPGAMAPTAAVIAIACIALGGGGSAVLNMWFERDLDRRMMRTAARPLPSGRITPDEALRFALVLIAGSVAVMAIAIGARAAVMLALTILFYGVVYTMWLKPRTPLNVVIGGGLASLLTPLTGWVAAGGALSLEVLVVFGFLVPWTAPHVWSQALVRAKDYANAGVPMMPVIAGSGRTRWLIAGFTAVHSVLALLPSLLGFAGLVWFALALTGGLGLSIAAIRLARADEDASPQGVRGMAWRFYRWNTVYVVALLSALIIERGMGVFVPMSSIAGFGG